MRDDIGTGPGLASGRALVAACVIAFGLANCSETRETIIENAPNPEGDDTLPSAIVEENRPENPATSFDVACPWGTVQEPLLENPGIMGSVFPDDIPSIDNPVFLPAAQADLEMFQTEFVIVTELAGQVRAFPVRILLHHEIVNMCWDTPDGPLFTYLTYCPLVNAAVHFTERERRCNAKNKFGVSGILFNGNLVTYDRRWADLSVLLVQMYGGGLRGSCGETILTTHSMTWNMYRRLYPNGEVLSGKTGLVPADGYDLTIHPYWEYWRRGKLFFPLTHEDDRMHVMSDVFGVITNAGRKAYKMNVFDFVFNDTVGADSIVVWHDGELVSTSAYDRVLDGQTLTFEFVGREAHGLPLYMDLESESLWNFDGIAVAGPKTGQRLARVPSYRSFWFAWSSMFPGTELLIPTPPAAPTEG